MREFNLEQALAGHPVCTRDGRPVTQLTRFDISGSVCWAGVVVGYNLCTWAADGRHDGDYCSHFDLVMTPIKKTGWVARRIYHREKTFYTSGEIYATEQTAKDCEPCAISYHQIEWEE
jgi:hypothetical protein